MDERQRKHRGTDYPVSAAHPAADAFPWMGEDALQELAADIAANGQHECITRVGGLVIDGRNRELACRVAGVEPRYADERLTEAEIIDRVVSANLRRRDLNPSQRAMAATEIAKLRPGRPAEDKTGNVAAFGGENDKSNTSQKEAAATFDVSERSIRSAARVKRDAPELAEKVKDGSLDVHTAEKVAKLPAAKRKRVAKAKDPKDEAKKQLASKKPTVEVVPPVAVDGWGIPIQPHAVEAFAAVPKFKELIDAIRHAQRLFNEVANAPGGKFLTLPDASSYRRGKKLGEGEYADRFVHTGLEDAEQTAKRCVPTYTVCPCGYADVPHPDPCNCCRGLNWTPVLTNSISPVCIDRAKAAHGVGGDSNG